MRSDLHEIFSKCEYWSHKLIKNVCGHAHACLHAQCMLTCMQLWVVKNTIIFQLNDVGFLQNILWLWKGHQRSFKKIWAPFVRAHSHNACICVCMRLYLEIAFKQCKILGWSRKLKFCKGSYSLILGQVLCSNWSYPPRLELLLNLYSVFRKCLCAASFVQFMFRLNVKFYLL